MSGRVFHAWVPLLARIAASAFLLCVVQGCDVLDDSQLRPQLNAGAGGARPAGAGGAGSGGASGDPASSGSGATAGATGAESGPRAGTVAPALDGGAPDGGAPVADGATPAPDCSPPAVDSYCTQIPALGAAPVIDGQLDCGMRLLELPPAGWNGMQPMPAQHRTLLAAAARPDGLYVYVEVHGGEPPRPHPADSYIDCGDAVEIYVDADGVLDELGAYSLSGTMQFIIAAPAPAAPATIEALRFIGGESQGAWSSQQVRTVLLPDGYAVEALITAGDLELTAWAPSGRIGFDIAVDVSAPLATPELSCGLQLGQYFMRMGPDGDGDAGICHGKPWCDTRAFCTPEI